MRRPPSSSHQYGFTVIEALVALVISVILLLGVINIFFASRDSYIMQNGVARLEENARFAFEIMSRSISLAGYEGADDNNVLPFDEAGTSDGASDSIAVNYMTSTIDCLGNATAANVINTDNFAIGLDGLTCKGQTIVRGITAMEILYGQDSTKHLLAAETEQHMQGIADSYLPYSQVTLKDDMSEAGGITSVRITLTATTISEYPEMTPVTRTFTRTILLRNYGNRPKHPVY